MLNLSSYLIYSIINSYSACTIYDIILSFLLNHTKVAAEPTDELHFFEL